MIPKTIGRYRIKAEIGRGGMSTVYLAHDPLFERDVAIKLLPQELMHQETFRRRFDREAKVVAALDHPAIVPVYDFGEQDGQPFLVMRFMTGGSLSDRLRQGAISVQEAARIINRLAPALDEVHAHHVIHRDLKPSNILFDQRDEPYISDFGTAKFIDAQTKLTQAGNAVGTPAYMSPEQIHGEAVLDGRSDIYALGVMLFEMLTGKHPYQTNTPIGVAVKHIFEPIPRILETQPDLPAACQTVLTRVMAKNREERYPTAVSFAEAVNIVAQFLQMEEGTGTNTGVKPVVRFRRLALLIGNDEYQDATLARLVKPTAQLDSLAKVLRDGKIGRFDEVTVLMNETADSIRRAISHFLANKQRPDLVLVYFVGHAALDTRGQVYLTVKDSEHGLLRGTAVSATFIAEEMNSCEAGQQLLMLDCHYSSTSNGKSPHLTGKAVDTGTSFSFDGRERVIITASDMTDYVWYDDEVVGRATESYFTHHLVRGLQSGAADCNRDGQITVDELFEYVQQQLATAKTADSPAPQPRKWSYNENAQLVLAYRQKDDDGLPLQPAASPMVSRRFAVVGWIGMLVVALSMVLWRVMPGEAAPMTLTPTRIAVINQPTVTVQASVTPTQTALPTETPPPTATAKPGATPTTAVSSPVPTSAPSTSKLATALLASSIFTQPDTTAAELGFIPEGETVIVLGRSPLGNWFYVQLNDGTTGYIYAPRLEWGGEFDSLPIITPTDTATTTGIADCGTADCPILQADIYPLPGARCEEGIVYRTIYLEGRGGDGFYTYYWNDVIIAGPISSGYGFEINNATNPITIGTGKVVSGDGQVVERELFVAEFECD